MSKFVVTALLALCSATQVFSSPLDGRDTSATGLQYLNANSKKYLVDPTGIPNVTFNVGENYAGQMPVGAASNNQSMFFWFFPTENPAGTDDIVIWFNGGPGCSSLEGFMQENGPMLWKPGTFLPTPNAYSWHKLANVVWVEYPIGTGFSTGPITSSGPDDSAAQFVEFWENFSTTFAIKNKRIFLTGESYAGVHIPYVGSAMLAQNNKKLFNVSGAIMYDAVLPYSDGRGQDQASLPAFARYWGNLLGLSSESFDAIQTASAKCGHDAYLQKYLTYPPPPAPFPVVNIDGDCDVLTPFFAATGVANPCFNQYHVSDTCAIQWDILGYPNMPYVPDGATIWFNYPAVRQAIHAPIGGADWAECQGPVYTGDGNYNSTQHEKRLQTLLVHTKKVIVGSGLLDMVIQPNVTALAIQMLKWNGMQGFQKKQTTPFMLPGPVNVDIPNLAGGAYQGDYHTERGLTHVTIKLSGHMVPQYAPSAAFRHLEVLLGRVNNLGSGADYSINISTNFTFPY